MGLLCGIAAIAVGVIAMKYSIAAIIAGATAIAAFFSGKRG